MSLYAINSNNVYAGRQEGPMFHKPLCMLED